MKKYVSLLLALVMVLGMLSGCAKDETPDAPDSPTPTPAPGSASDPDVETSSLFVPIPEASAYKKDVVIGVNHAFTVLDPHGTFNVNHNVQNVLVYDRLLSWNTEKKMFEPELATEWKWLDNTTLNIKLRDDVYFHNGEKMTADDVEFSFKRCVEIGQTGAANMKMVTDFEIINDYELNLCLSEANVDFLAYLALAYSSIVNREAVEKDDTYGCRIGTGAWICVEMSENDYMKLKRNDNYWGEKPKSETMTIRTIPEDSTRLIALQNKEVDICFNPNVLEKDIIEQDAKLSLYSFDRTGCTYFAFNSQQAPGNDQNFRLAVAYAIDVDELMVVGADGMAKKATTNWGWTTYGYDESIPARTRDLNKAKEYLAKTEHRTLEITCTAGYKLIAETIQAQLKDIGVTVNVNEVQSAAQTAMTKFATASHQSMVYGLSWNEHAEDARRPYYKDSNANKAVIHDQDIYDLIDAGKREFDDAKRKEIYSKVQQLNQDRGYYLPLYFAQGLMAMDKNAGGVQLSPSNIHDLTYFCVAEK